MQNPSLEHILIPRAHDLGGFEVRRALPSQARQMVGPFVFFDQIGPGEFLTGHGLDVRPHPHIGLATVTYLFDGAIMHRDSLGTQQSITPGDVNWMTAGRGIAHSERTDAAARSHSNRLFGIPSWVALPSDAEEGAPDFAHYPAATLPVLDDAGLRLRLVAGEGWGLRSPVAVRSSLVYADVQLAPGAPVPLPDAHEEQAAYVLDGEVDVAGDRFAPRPDARVPRGRPFGAARRAARCPDIAAGRRSSSLRAKAGRAPATAATVTTSCWPRSGSSPALDRPTAIAGSRRF